MSRKDAPRKKESSDSESGSDSSEELPANKFVNDGSFMELFRKRMEEQKQSSESGS